MGKAPIHLIFPCRQMIMFPSIPDFNSTILMASHPPYGQKRGQLAQAVVAIPFYWTLVTVYVTIAGSTVMGSSNKTTILYSWQRARLA